MKNLEKGAGIAFWALLNGSRDFVRFLQHKFPSCRQPTSFEQHLQETTSNRGKSLPFKKRLNRKVQARTGPAAIGAAGLHHGVNELHAARPVFYRGHPAGQRVGSKSCPAGLQLIGYVFVDLRKAFQVAFRVARRDAGGTAC
jgi:hypothetical protein